MDELKLEDAKWRIKELYERTNGNCIIAFSGGKDSTVIVDIYLRMKEQGEVGFIPIMFADTQVEYKAVSDFIKWFSENKQEVIRVKSDIPFAKVLEKYGRPAMSKLKSSCLATYHRALKKGEDPMTYKCVTEMISGHRTTKDLEVLEATSFFRLANKHFHFLHPDHETKIEQRCCYFMKKQPFEKFYIENNIAGYITGMRTAEGGTRAMVYKSCTHIKKIDDRTIVQKMPIIDWTDEDVDQYIEEYNVKLSEAYTKYGLERTGCIGCPFAQDLEESLHALWKYEPNKYKAVMKWLGDVYIDLEVQLTFDKEYMKKYRKRLPIIQKRRYEMLKKYKPDIAHKWKPKTRQTLLDL